ncbi:MAG: NAD(P)H-dependent glycerol-3-phosphate dehydrogenase [Candidatus Omnitrophota bacterium]|nr:NAD(P)-dependent glycerol-3-phosphate dehydrogenase [Candidatus Omnitrophota bacterium]MBU2528304.1 NAD(P)-dependent glycerol-3-phosphate dehydrogenase [bacterium]MBU3929681.1 NAD(P)-dependent glycerol-3-phosphate dehydrogenase [bacterium]MBU4122638.1 NAD(P)-dependent glycerol-3-phosphate dehydrogenase [bacterium]
MFDNIFIMGGGCWATAVASALQEGASITIWEIDPARRDYFRKHGHPKSFSYVKLRGVKFADDLQIPAGTNLLIAAVPAQTLRPSLMKIADFVKRERLPVLVLSKGIEIRSLKSLDAVCLEVLGRNVPVAVMTGPSHAEELAVRQPTSVVVASKNRALASKVQKLFTSDYFRPYVQSDIRGAALGGAIKNVMATAAGVCDGLGLGINAKAALVTRGLAEMTRLGIYMGGKRATFSGLSGVGDLIVTAFSTHSRNRNLGEALGRGMTLEQAKKKVKTTAEGAETVRALVKIASKGKVDAPITKELFGIMYKGRPAHEAIGRLMGRAVRKEDGE